MNRSQSKNGVGILIFLGWLVYTTSYLGKVNYSANITQIIDFYGISKAEAGIVPTFFFFAYGIGQVVNGILCRKYNIKWTVFTSLALSAVINFIIAVSTDFSCIKWLWLANGFLMSMLWPTLVRLLSETLPEKDLGKSSVIMGTTVAAGTLIIYSLSSLYVAFDKFKLAFYTAAFVEMVVAIIWVLSYKRAVEMAKLQKSDEIHQKSDDKPVDNKEKNITNTLLGTISVLCFCAVGVNLIKDGLTTWVPSILKEEGSVSDSISILLTLFLPMVAIAGNAFALSMHNKIPDYVKNCMTVFVIAMVIIGIIIGGLSLKNVVLMLAGMVVVNFLISSLNSLITSIFPMYMREHINSGRWAGILNGFCYMGSTISSYGLGTIADCYGWSAVFWCLFAVCAVIAGVCGGYIFFQCKLQNTIV